MRNRKLCPSLEDVGEQAIRGQIFSVERLEEYAIYLAENLQTDKAPELVRPLLHRLHDNSHKLLASYKTLISALHAKELISPAAEWLVDNFHIVEEQIREIKNDLPKSYYEELPKLSVGNLAGYPRIYALALACVAHTDSRLEMETIRRFVQAFQKKSYLNIGELWAVAITLRLVLVENARRIALRVTWDRNQRNDANALADEIIQAASSPEHLRKVIAKIPQFCGKAVDFEYAFIAQLAKRLRDQEVEIWPAAECLEEILSKLHYTTEQLVNLDHQQQAANQVTIANTISSMRLLSNINWQSFFEAVSLLDQDLAADPSGDYAGMDFSTRDEYRHAVERIGKRTKVHERVIANKAVELARGSQRHVGYYLKGEGIGQLEHQFKYKPRIREIFHRMLLRYPEIFYLGSLGILIGLISVVPLLYAASFGFHFVGLILLFLLLFIPCSDLAVSVLNYLVTHLIPPRTLPKMDLMLGVPSQASTLVVIPCMLFDAHTIQELLEKLEVHYLGNSDPEIFFALVTDFIDADAEKTPEDQALLEMALAGIDRLNGLYRGSGEERFFLFHRDRRWNSAEKVWMGWERKRGKLDELNQVLRGETQTSFSVVTCGDPRRTSFKYVITLDADTQLGRDTAKKLIGTALHPLNRPQLDQNLQRVVTGYGIIQPRISITLESSSRSLFAVIFSGHTGIDPYTTAVSDVYQDLFGEGSFTGKGLYDIDAFREALRNRVPENTVLSHDLLEGLYARVALATDIELLDDYPKTYASYFSRQHRWVRGDWQISQWIFDRSLPGISRWKIYDNLRRSLVAFGILLVFIFGWLVLPGSSFFWTSFALVVMGLPCFLHVAGGVFISPRGVPWTSNFWSEVSKTKINFGQFFFSLTFLAHQAFIQLDAVFRALFRILISKKKRLEWVPSAQVDRTSGNTKKSTWQSLWPVEGAVLAILTALLVKGSLVVLALALPFLILWACYPFVASLVSRPWRFKVADLTNLEKSQLDEIARRIWHFFETFVGPEDNWLPPDNVQEDPEQLVAHRTSPTNIGLYALSILAARDGGYMNLRGCFENLRNLVSSLNRLERFEGHFLNWYDTQSLEPLEPRYVSSVDSGNLAGYLLIVKQSCAELRKAPLFHRQILEGIKTTFAIIEQEIHQLQEHRQTTASILSSYLKGQVLECKKILGDSSTAKTQEWAPVLHFLRHSLEDLRDSIVALESEHGARYYSRLKSWVDANARLVESLNRDFELFCPWAGAVFRKIENDLQDTNSPKLESWKTLLEFLNQISDAEKYHQILQTGRGRLKDVLEKAEAVKPEDIASAMEALVKAEEAVSTLLETIDGVQRDVEVLFSEMNFSFLLDATREVFFIGYNVREGRHDNAYYDLLASESRLASFIAIAKGDTSQKHWFRLGRQLVPVDGGRALISWSASMFEYLMPHLVMKNFESTLLHETMDAVVKKQIIYGKKMKVPWGISEAGYNARDLNFNYQYGPFGIPGLGLKRGLSHDLVISPYSTFLAALIDPREAMENVNVLIKKDLLTCYGFYEAVDYTPERLSSDQKFAVVKSFMAHHQGMSLVAITNLLHKNIMQKRFHADLRVRATQLLLQERVPQKVTMSVPKAAEIEWEGAGESTLKSFTRVYENPNLATPRVQLLSNGTYSLMLSSAGAGYSKCEGLAVTRWREDATRDNWGSYIFVRDLNREKTWSATYQPLLHKPDSYRVIFAEDKVDYWREDGDIKTRTQIIVAPEDNLEIRYLSITNDSLEEKAIEVTSYLEPILAPLADDQAHPVFNNLFLQTEFLASKHALLAKRRPRSAQKKEVWGCHSIVVDDPTTAEIEYESDRSRFLGRGRTLLNALALHENIVLSRTVGSTLDPILSLRVRLKMSPGSTRHIAFNTGLAHSREDILQIVDRYHDIHAFERETKLAWTKAHIDLRHLGMDSEAAYLFQRLAERILYVDPSLRQPSHFLAEHTREQASLWPYGISGDLPIVVITVGDAKDMGMLRRLLRGHEYLRMKGLIFDLVVLNDSKTSYLQELQDEIQRQIRYSGIQGWVNKPGGVFLIRLDTLPTKDRALIQAMARVTLSSEWGSLKEQISRKVLTENHVAEFRPTAPRREYQMPQVRLPQLEYFNGLGGFTQDGKEYVTFLREEQWTPAPWINVIANPHDFGFQVSESGSGFTWAVNSRENRLTTWSNDPVSDPPSEVIYLRDEETGEFWTPTPLPVRDSHLYIIRHGQGYTTFEHNVFGFMHTLTLFVAKDDPVKIFHLRIKNLSGRTRKISLTAYVEWVLGNQRDKSAPYILTELDTETGAIFAKNAYNHEFAERISFFSVSESKKQFTCDRKEFLGRNGDYRHPEAMLRQGLSSRKGIGLDPCGVLQTSLEIRSNQECEVVFMLGQAESRQSAQEFVRKYSDLQNVENSYNEVREMWEEILGVVKVKTPDTSVNFMMNRWFLYQALVCRMWARSAFYQSGGAYGFRDQLQDCMAFAYASPELVRKHLLRAAGRQFPEGDVQHWWHPPSGRGVRTHFSDDLLWLPFVVSHYIRVTGDKGVLQEKAPFIEAPLLASDQEDSYTQPEISHGESTLLDHCLRTIEHSLTLGSHGLPLIGCGDWNDGMNRIGEKGQGESVWMGWFLYKVLKEFLPFCDAEHKQRYTEHMHKLQEALEKNAWDGNWYRRAYFDDGTPLGSSMNDECQIDSLSQTWSVLSGAGDPQRQLLAMQKVSERLILWDSGLVLLLTPPFDKTVLDPGYIKGYVPGVRENGGQYTHAALWVVMAFAELGDSEKVYELFSLLNPIHHSQNRQGLHRYKIEPYVVPADIYAVAPHLGRGGWSWYTGSASWFYRAGLESLLGFYVIAERIFFKPCVPKSWKYYEMTYRYKSSVYEFRIENRANAPDRNIIIKENGHVLSKNGEISLVDDGQVHQVIVQNPV